MLYPQRGRTQLFQLIAAYIRDNALNQVTPADFRRVLREIVSSDWNRADDGTNNGGGGSATQLVDFITLDEASRMAGAANPADGAQPGVLYVIVGSVLKQWNGGSASETVFVDGLVNAFAPTGCVDAGGLLRPVNVDVAAGTWQLSGASNATPSLRKSVEFRTIAEKMAFAGAPADATTMEELDEATMCQGTEIYVANDPDGIGEYKVVYGGPLSVWVDGNFGLGTRGRIQAKIVPNPGGGTALPTVDLLDLTTIQMNEVMALTYTDCDADPAASPAWSRPGQWFDAKQNGENRHYYCGRGTYDPTDSTTGAGPAWHRFQKLD